VLNEEGCGECLLPGFGAALAIGVTTERRSNRHEAEVDTEAFTEDGSGERLLVSVVRWAVNALSD
jgi:hypothetical protein